MHYSGVKSLALFEQEMTRHHLILLSNNPSPVVKQRPLACAVSLQERRKASDCCGRGGASTNRTELMDVELSVPCKGEISKELNL